MNSGATRQLSISTRTQALQRSMPNQWTQSYQLSMSKRTLNLLSDQCQTNGHILINYQCQNGHKLLSDQCQTNGYDVISYQCKHGHKAQLTMAKRKQAKFKSNVRIYKINADIYVNVEKLITKHV